MSFCKTKESCKETHRKYKKCGATLWLTGLSGSGKTTICQALLAQLSPMGIAVKILDGDELRLGINKDLKFLPEDRKENIRRTAEIALMFALEGFITIVALISPYIKDREMAKVLHQEKNIPFFEIFIKTSIEECEKRDPKGLYALARKNAITDMTGLQSPYEEPKEPFLTINTYILSIQESTEIILNFLKNNIIVSKDEIKVQELFLDEQTSGHAKLLSKYYCTVELEKIDIEWLQVLSEGWAHPLKGFMREIEYLQCLHFSMVKDRVDNTWHILPIPIVLSIDDSKKEEIETSHETNLTLVYNEKCIGTMKNIEIYAHGKDERCCRVFGINSLKHPAIEKIQSSGSWLIGGDIELFERISWNDGLDKYRLTLKQIKDKVISESCDALCAFQLRNPIHNGHALLIRNTLKMMKEKHFKRPMLLLHPLGGWTKEDDVPLSVRIKQHEAVLRSGELDSKSTILAIFPSPMSYAGPTEVLWHCKARLLCGVNFYIVGRDPAGLPHPDIPSTDLYNPTHGAKILLNAPHLENLEIVPFPTIAYNRTKGVMEIYDSDRKSEYEFISGTKMRKIAREGGSLPDGFMVLEAWKVIEDYYK